MADLRGYHGGWGAGLTNVSDSIGALLHQIMQDSAIRKRQQLENEGILKRQQALNASNERIKTQEAFLPGIKSGQYNNRQLPPQLVEALGGQDVLSAMMPSNQQLAGGISSEIQAAKKPEELPTPPGLINQALAKNIDTTPSFGMSPLSAEGPEGELPARFGQPTSNPVMSGLYGELGARKNQFEQEKQAGIIEAGQKAQQEGHGRAVGTAQGGLEVLPATMETERGKGQVKNALDLEKLIGETPEHARRAGLEAGARSQAEYPWQMKLAQARADTALLNQKNIYDYQQAHPKATSQELNRASAATAARGSINEARVMLDEADKRHMLGPLASYWTEYATNPNIKSENFFRSKEDAQLASQMTSAFKLLSSMAAVAHGGARGGGSPMMSKFFESIVNAHGDRAMTEGQLQALDNIMSRYQQNASTTMPDMEVRQILGIKEHEAPSPTPPPAGINDYLNYLRGGR